MKGSITAGVFFVIVGVVYLLEAAGVWDIPSGYLLPAALIALGVALLVGGAADRA